MRNLLYISVLFIIGFTKVSGQTAHDCPSYPSYYHFDKHCYIEASYPAGEVLLPEARVHGLYVEYPMDIHVPTNRYSYAIGMAHAWNYTRNLIKKVDYPKLSLWMATATIESGFSCDCQSQWSPTDYTPWGETNFQVKCNEALTVDQGCFHMEEQNGWSSIKQWYPDRFVGCDGFSDLISKDNFETSAILYAYWISANYYQMEYKWGWNMWPIIENTADPYAFEKTMAASWNAGMNNVWQNGAYKYIGATVRANAIADDNWDLYATSNKYATDIGWAISILENNLTYPGADGAPYNTPIAETATSFDAFDGYFNGDIYWDTVQTYLDEIQVLYHEYSAADWVLVTDSVRNSFIVTAGDINSPIPFKQIGPVIDAMVLQLPAENSLMNNLQVSGTGTTPDGYDDCYGNYAPASTIHVSADTVCEGLSLDVKAIIDGGDGPNLTYNWFVNGAPAPQYDSGSFVMFPIAGTYTFNLEVCNPDLGGCAYTCCERTVVVEACTGCLLGVTPSTSNTPCKSMNGGTIDLAITGSSDFTVIHQGPANGSVTGTGSSISITDLPDGVYDIIVQDNGTPTCQGFATATIDYDVAINEVVDASVTSVNGCDAQLDATLLEYPAPCNWRVEVQGVNLAGWEPYMYVMVSTANANNPVTLKRNHQNQGGVANFSLYSGDTIKISAAMIEASGGCFNGAVNYMTRAIEVRIFDESNNEVYMGTIPAGGVIQDVVTHVVDYAVDCPFIAASYTYSWSPLGGNVEDPLVSGSGDVLYTVTATNVAQPQCQLQDTVTVPFDCSSGCTPPSSALATLVGSASICADDSSEVTANVEAGYLYTWYLEGNEVVSGIDLVSYQVKDSGAYTVRIADPLEPTNAACYLTSSEVTVDVDPVLNPLVSIQASTTTLCGSSIDFTISTSQDIQGGVSYDWVASVLGASQSTSDNWSGASGLSDGEEVFLEISGLSGCIASGTIYSDTITLTQGVLPTGYSLQMQDSACDYENIQIDMINGANADDFEWAIQGGTLASDTTGVGTSMILVDPISTTLIISGTPLNGCGQQTPMSDSTVITPSPAASITNSLFSYCEGSAGLTLYASGGDAYEWIGTQTGVLDSLANATVGTYQVIASVAGCADTSSIVTLTEILAPTAVLTGGDTICSDSSELASLQLSLTGTGPWEVILTNEDTLNVSSSAYNYLTYTQGGIGAISVTDHGTSCSTLDIVYTDSAVVSANTIMDTSNYAVSCNGNDVQISFDLTGGVSSGYAVTGVSGTISGNSWTSDLLAENVLHSLSVTAGTSCNNILLNVQRSCSCLATADLSGTASICEAQDSTELIINLSGGADYAFDLQLNGVVAQSFSGLNQSSVSVWVSDTGSYTINDFTGPCTGSINGSARVDFFAPVTTLLSGGGEICADGSATTALDLSLTGSPNWTVVLSNSGVLQAAQGITASPSSISVSDTGRYKVETVVDGNGCSLGTPSVDEVTVSHYATLDTTNFSVICDSADRVVVRFNISGGDVSGYSVVGVSGQLNGSLWVSEPLAELTAHNLTISDGTPCGQVISTINHGCSCQETASLSGDQSICPSGDTATIILATTISGGFTADLLLDGTFFQSVSGSGNALSIEVDQVGDYTLGNLQGTCSGSVSGQAAVSALDVPSYEFGPDVTLCGNTNSTSQFIRLTGGTGPYDLNLSLLNGSWDSAMTNQAGLIGIDVAQEGDYVINELTDQNGCVLSNYPDTFSLIFAPAPSYTLQTSSGNEIVCADGSLSRTVEIHFTGTAPYDFTYNGIVVADWAGDVFTVNSSYANTYTLSALEDENCTASDFQESLALVYETDPGVPSLSVDSLDLCGDEVVQVTASSTGTGVEHNWFYQNQFFATADEITISSDMSGTISVAAAINQVCDLTSPLVHLDVGRSDFSDLEIVLDEDVILESETVTATIDNSETGQSFVWNVEMNAQQQLLGSNSTQSYSSSVSGDYTFIVDVTQDGCSDQLFADFVIASPLEVNNSFSPNGDGVNDEWTIPGLEAYAEAQVKIFNRWGTKVYQVASNYADLPWDGNYNGKPLPPGTYYYTIALNIDQSLTGSITIVR